jgi:hypothetical protein
LATYSDIMDKYSFNSCLAAETMKDALDPASILSPGKNGILAQGHAKGESMKTLGALLFAALPVGSANAADPATIEKGHEVYLEMVLSMPFAGCRQTRHVRFPVSP